MNKLILFGIIICLCITSVSAQLIVSPSSQSVDVFKGVPKVFSVSLFNNNSFPISNVSFSPVQDFSFPSGLSLVSNEVRNVSFVVSTNLLYSASRVSVVSFLYNDLSACNFSSRVVDLNLSDSGVSSPNVFLWVNDSLRLNNFGSSAVVVSSFVDSSIFSSLPVGGSSTNLFSSVGNFSFYRTPGGQTFNVFVVDKPLDCLVHSSSFDVPVQFSVSSVFSPSTLQFVNLLPSNFSSNNNQSQFGVLEVKNFDNLPLHNVVLSDSRGWVQFSVNNFTLNGLENRLVNFNLTPFVTRTNDTNVSLPIQFFAVSSNGGNGSIGSSVFVAYQNLDSLLINGTSYIINRLSINDSIAFCKNYPSDVECLALVDAFKSNITVVKEIPASKLVSEERWLEIDRKIDGAFAGQDRVINTGSRLINYVENDTLPLIAKLSDDVQLMKYESASDRATIVALLEDGRKDFRFWLIVSGVWLSFAVIVYFVKIFYEFDFRKKSGQW